MNKEQPVYSIDHFQGALRDFGDLPPDNIRQIPDMTVASRLHVTAGMALRLASRQTKCPWQSWRLDSFIADGTTCDRLGDDFAAARMVFSGDCGKSLRIDYEDNAVCGTAYLDDEYLFGWTG